MDEYIKIFTSQDHMGFEGIVSDAKQKSQATMMMSLFLVLASMLLLGLGIMDWEIYFRIFEHLSGDDGYWSPHLMAFTGIVMMIAFHILAKHEPNHLVVHIVKWITGLIIIAFMIGGGLYISQMLYNDGMGEPSDTPIVIGGVVQSEIKQDWIETLFEKFTSPTAILTLSLGIGGLSIVALYVAHYLLHVIEKNISEIYSRLSTLRSVLALHQAIKRAESLYADLITQEYELSFQDGEYWKHQIADEVLDEISKELMPHEQVLQEDKISMPNPLWEQTPTEDTKHITAMIKKIKAITLSDILKAMSLPKHLRK